MDNVRISVLTLVGNRLTRLLLTRLHPETETTPFVAAAPETPSDEEIAQATEDEALLVPLVPTGPDLAAVASEQDAYFNQNGQGHVATSDTTAQPSEIVVGAQDLSDASRK